MMRRPIAIVLMNHLTLSPWASDSVSDNSRHPVNGPQIFPMRFAIVYTLETTWHSFDNLYVHFITSLKSRPLLSALLQSVSHYYLISHPFIYPSITLSRAVSQSSCRHYQSSVFFREHHPDYSRCCISYRSRASSSPRYSR